MATREKKLSLNRKQQTTSSSPVPQQKESQTSSSSSSSSDQNDVLKIEPIETTTTTNQTQKNQRSRNTSSLVKQIQRKAVNKVIKSTTIGIKPKVKKLNQRKAKKILKLPEVKKTLLKNGINSRKVINKKEPTTPNLELPSLEPIFRMVNENSKKKRNRGKEDDKKKDDECKNEDDDVDEAIHSIISELDFPKKKKTMKKLKTDETIDEVMGDLAALMKIDDEVKTETDVENTLEKPRKKLNKVSILKDLKKDNLERMESSKVIDTLDLNVTQKKNTTLVTNRRHSSEENCTKTNNPNLTTLNLFSNIPRSISPKSKRMSRFRQSIEKQRSSPYSTRSDSPARILRNGKHRKLKDLTLLDGLDIEHRRRKRLCSDYSGGSEVSVSKSGYESDSSFSDLVSLHGSGVDSTENDIIKKESSSITPSELKDEENEKGNIEQQKPEQNVDTNSNLCESEPEFDSNPSLKVPDKSKILGIMKQTFNDVDEKKSINVNETTLSINTDTFYGNSNNKNEENLPQLQPIKEINLETNQNGIELNNEDEEEELDQNEEPPILEPMNIIEDNLNHEEIINQEKAETKSLNEEPKINESPNEILQEVPQENHEEQIPEETPKIEEDKSESTQPEDINIEIVESPESLAIKETILKALGLQSLKAAEEAKLKGLQQKESPNKTEMYTGTLKTVIKLNRSDRKRGKKLSLQKNRRPNKENKEDKEKKDDDAKNEEKPSTSAARERESTWKTHGNQSSESAVDGSSEHTSDGDAATGEDGKSLVIPEKASSFSIHPGRLCKDECSYCFGKFGLFDTPCHIAQIKTVERQDKVLAAEKHLTRDSCLCDACFRHVDRKSNIPSYTSNKTFKRNVLVAPAPKENHCHVLGCRNESNNILRRKWIIKMRKNICKVINIDLDNPGLHSIPICDEHYTALEHLMTCAMCKRKLAKNHIHYLGQELTELNEKLNAINIPVKLEDKPVVCKLCKYYATLTLSNEEDPSTEKFFKEYTRRLLHFHDVEPMNEGEVEEPILIPVKDTSSKMETEHRNEKSCSSKKKKKGSKSPTPTIETTTTTSTTTTVANSDTQNLTDTEQLSDQNNVPSSESRAESPSDYMVDYQTLIPNIAMDCGSDLENAKKEPRKSLILKKVVKTSDVKDENKKICVGGGVGTDIAVQRLGSNPSISVRQLFPGEEDLPLQGTIEFNNVKERTPEGWEKCTATIQYDADTKHLWQELQKPYGNQSSFLRHLILLEKYFRNGDLILSPNASHHSVNYSESVQNRLRAYDNTPTSSGNIQPLTMIPFNKAPQKNHQPQNKDQSNLNVINAANIPKNTPITLNQLNSSGLLVNTIKTSSGVPPGLMPLQPGTSKPIAPLVKVPQPQKIKFPITKNWRPNLIPIDPNKKIEKRPGLVQVISGGKPYHITLEDYKKMCAIKRTFDLKQKKIQEGQKSLINLKPSVNSLLKSLAPKKITVSKTSILNPLNTNKSNDLFDMEKEESSLEKLDRQVEKLEMKLNEPNKQQPVVMILPKIPKSLTVIPQTVPRKPSRPSSPTLQIVTKPKSVQRS
ncbi:uncharacterized protein [Onthophagus taurus]|uniref:uncharacterized protein isoform X2 n=1 Tax=Onthophagus taurus TaxID=166361 RepID=UPI000C206D82|nr:uncharacterized protein LOC111417549 isoform X2 [Onthophagus taurus]